MEDLYPEELYQTGLEYPGAVVLDIFERLKNVRSVHLDGLGRDHTGLWRLSDEIHHFFPATTEVQLSGDLSGDLTKKLLGSINLANLTALSLDALQDPSEPLVLVPGFYLTRPSKRLLEPLEGRCVSLRRLSLRIPCHSTGEARSESTSVLKEYASFLASVRTSLQHLTFEQFEGPTRAAVGPANAIRPMDEQFAKMFMLVFFTGHWPCLARVEIRGVRLVHNWWFDSPLSSIYRYTRPDIVFNIKREPEKKGDITYLDDPWA